MTRDRINKHIEVFEHWRNGGDVLVSSKRNSDGTRIWRDVINPSWYMDCIYIQKDKYVEIRRAFAEGKTIQYCTISELWNDIASKELPDSLFNSKYKLRIKPDTFTKKTIYINDGTGEVIFEKEEKATEVEVEKLRAKKAIRDDWADVLKNIHMFSAAL